MTIRIEEQKPEIPVEIGELKFSFKVTDEAVLGFRKNALEVAEKLSSIELKGGEEEVLKAAQDALRHGFDAILGEGAYNKLYEMTPSVVLLMRYFEQLAAGLSDELKALGLSNALDKRAKKYLK